MAKQATKLASEPEARALATQTPDKAMTVKAILDAIPRYADIKTLDRPAVVGMAAKDWFDTNPDGVKLMTATYKVAESFAELIITSHPYVTKWRDLMKINASKAMENPDRTKWEALNIKTFKSFGISVIPGTTVTMNGKEVEVTEDDAITWTKWCKVVYDRTPQHVNSEIRATIGDMGKQYQPEPEPHPAPVPTINAPSSEPPPGFPGRTTKIYKMVEEADEDEIEDEDETPVPPGPKPATQPKAMMPVPDLKPGDVDALINFLNADSVIGAVTPMDAVFGELSDFDLAKKAGSWRGRSSSSTQPRT